MGYRKGSGEGNGEGSGKGIRKQEARSKEVVKEK
jgi:hypothetical protein